MGDLDDSPSYLEEYDEDRVVEGHPPGEVAGGIAHPTAPASYEEKRKRASN